HAKPKVGHLGDEEQEAFFVDRKYLSVSRRDGICGSGTVVDDGHFAKNVAVSQPLDELRAPPNIDPSGLDDIEDIALLATMKDDLSSFECKQSAAVAGENTEIEVGMCHAKFSSGSPACDGSIAVL